jgi:chromate reductase, NAD(P)H dehydrogenase (quinone)
MPTYNLVAVSGSLRKGSLNTMVVKAFKENAPEGVAVEILDYSDFVVYNQDFEADFPSNVTSIKSKIKSADGVIISTPEYNRTIPGPLKNFIDWTSRPYGDSAWNEKPVFIASASGGSLGGALASMNLHQAFVYLNARVMGQPEFYMNHATSKFDEQGILTDEETKKHIADAFAKFTAFIEKFR